jgi:hypothetical protein
MIRHVRVEVLASYAVGELKPRKAAHVASHLTGCADCSTKLRALQDLPRVLRSVQFSPMPDNLVSRISMAIAAESAAKVASQPASEAGRLDLPASSRPARRRSWFPRLSSPLALRVAAAAGAAVVVAGGGYELATHVGNGETPTSSGTPSAAQPGIPASQSGGQAFGGGPRVSYVHAGHQESISAVTTATNYAPGTLGAQAAEELAALRKSTPLSNATASPGISVSGVPANTPALPLAQLQGCVRRIAAGHLILLVDLAEFLKNPATVIVVQGKTSGVREAFAVGSSCSAAASDILAQQVLP